MSNQLPWIVGVPLSLLVAASLLPRTSGMLPSSSTSSTANIARAMRSCGDCHRSTPGGSAAGVAEVDTAVTLDKRSLAAGEAVAVSVAVSGGPNVTNPTGGFTADADSGAWNAMGNTRVSSTGRWIAQSTRTTQSWSFGYTAPAQPGPTELYFVGLAGNGSGDGGDYWCFHGASSSAQVSTPVHVYVNASGVTRLGAGHDGCVGPFENWPVLGARQSPTVPNPNFGFELVGAPTASSATLLIGVPSPMVPLDLVGLPGCSLLSTVIAAVGPVVTTGVAGSQLGAGTATFAVPLAPGISLGTTIAVQVGIIHASAPVAGRALPLTLTNALQFTTQ